MNDFISTMMNPDFPFLRYALISALLASVSFGTVGTFVVVRRIGSIAGAISHSVLGGIGAALYFQAVYGLTWLKPMHGAMIAALLSAVVIGYVSLRVQEREDTIIAALWSIGMAVGLLFLARTPGYVDPMSYLFGNILLLSPTDLWTILVLDIVVVGVISAFFHTFVAVCFDEEFARLQGIKVEVFYLILLCLTALTVVLLVNVVGIVMVIALLTIPAAVAGFFSKRLWQMIVLAIGLAMIFTVAGLFVSFHYDLPGGPSIIAVAGSVYIVVLAGSRLFKKSTT